MACRLSELVLDCRDPQAQADSWCAVLGYQRLDEEGGAVEIGPAAGFGGPAPTLVLSPSGSGKTAKLPLHLDVSPTDRDQDAELARLLALGARRVDVGQRASDSWHVLADPEGDEFCLLRSRLAPA